MDNQLTEKEKVYLARFEYFTEMSKLDQLVTSIMSELEMRGLLDGDGNLVHTYPLIMTVLMDNDDKIMELIDEVNASRDNLVTIPAPLNALIEIGADDYELEAENFHDLQSKCGTYSGNRAEHTK